MPFNTFISSIIQPTGLNVKASNPNAGLKLLRNGLRSYAVPNCIPGNCNQEYRVIQISTQTDYSNGSTVDHKRKTELLQKASIHGTLREDQTNEVNDIVRCRTWLSGTFNTVETLEGIPSELPVSYPMKL